MRRFIFTVVICIVGANSFSWDAISKTQESLNRYQDAAKQIIKTMEQVLAETKIEATNFIEEIEELTIVKDVNSLLDGDECKIHVKEIKVLKEVFKLHFFQLERPILKAIGDTNGRLNEVLAQTAVYEGLAVSKMWACSLKGRNCTEEIKSWVQDNMDKVLCKIVEECKSHNLSKRSTCGYNSIEIRGHCINRAYLCNGNCDHGGCDDEDRNICNPCYGQFRCNNLNCIDKNDICDGKNDCDDGSDEEGCSPIQAHCTVESGKFLCDNTKKCISISDLCDGSDDCGDGSDEGGHCGESFCDPGCTSAGGVCFQTPRGSVCLSSCPPGTTETLKRCLSGPRLPLPTISELLEDMPRLTTRFVTSFKDLQRSTIDQLYTSLSKILLCKGGDFKLIGSIVNLDFPANPPHTTTHKPHTTTHKPHTTTHRPHTTTSHKPHTTSHKPTETPSYDEEYWS